MRITRLFVVLFLLGVLLVGCDSGCSCQQESAPPPPPPEPEEEEEVTIVQESELEVIRPDTSDVLKEAPTTPSAKPEPVESSELTDLRRERVRERPRLADRRRETVVVTPVPPPMPVIEPDAVPVPVSAPMPEPVPVEEPEIELEHAIEVMEGPYGIIFAKIPDGQYSMGSEDDEWGRDLDEGPTKEITVSEFWLGQTEVTLRQWRSVMGHLPFRWQSGNAPPEWTLDEPVRYVSWDEVRQFLSELSRQTGSEYRLPTESEWEYACRGWEETAFWCGDHEADVRETDWMGPYGALHEVKTSGRFNPFGLYDMHGNVSEWVEDDYVDTFRDFPDDGSAYIYHPRLPLRLSRGGNFLSTPGNSRSAAREPVEPSTRFSTIGFRIATENMTEVALGD